MKKTVLFLLLALCLVLVLASCDVVIPLQTEGTTTGAAESITAPESTVATLPDFTTSGETTVTTEFVDPNIVPIVTDDYTAIPNEFEWSAVGAVDYSKFTYSGTGAEVVRKLDSEYIGWKKSWYVLGADGSKTETPKSDIRKMETVGAAVVADEATKAATFTFTEMISKVEPAWKKVTAKAGSYLMFEFTTNLSGGFYITVTAKENGAASSAVYKQDGIEVKGENGKYVGIAKCTVPYQAGKTYYINICFDDGASYPIAASVPVTITPAKYISDYRLQFIGEWEQVEDPEYLPNLIDLFYNVYPRLYARFAFGNEPKEITFEADKQYDGVAYCSGTRVCVSVDYANKNPRDLGFFSHEITHSVQQYSKLTNYGGSTTYTDPVTKKTYTAKAWWTENMANFGGFRYFHWGYSTKFVQIYNVQTQSGLWDWGWEPYGDGSKLFLSYLDITFPSIDKNNDKKLDVSEYGVIDLLNYTIKTAKQDFSDNPYDPTSPFNKAVNTATNGKFSTMEEVRQQYEADCKSGKFVFTGFADCVDNWRTENLSGIPNPTYPSLKKVEKGSKTAPVLETAVIEGTNLAKGATIVSASSQGGSKNPIANLLDGDINTQWQGAKVTDDYKYELSGYLHEVIIDLGETKTFDTYTLANAGAKSSNKNNNTSEWELFVSDDGKAWTSVDYQNGNTKDIASVNIGDTTARYVMLRIFSADQGAGSGTVRLCEFMLFDQK